MQENNNIRFQDLDQVLLSAQSRRSADLGGWLTHYFGARRQAQTQRETNPENTISQLPRAMLSRRA
jgi:hypothetical protein